jgi:hypothetical protein
MLPKQKNWLIFALVYFTAIIFAAVVLVVTLFIAVASLCSQAAKEKR